MWILSIWKLIKLPHNRWYVLLLTSTCILSFENFSINVVYKQYFIEEIAFLESETIEHALNKKPLQHFSSNCTMLHCLPKKVIVVSLFSKGIFTIKWAIVLRAGFWMSMVCCLIAYFFARQKLSKILQFPIFGGGCMKLVSFDQNFIDWHICKSQTHLYLLKDKERLLLIIEWSTLQLLGF